MKEKRIFKAGNMLYPVPAVLVSAADRDGNSNLFTVAWAGTICTNPPMLSISVRPERYSYHMIRETGEFVVNLTTEQMAWATDYCGVRSGRDTDKWKDTGLTREPASQVSVPLVKESPVCLECRVVEVKELGSHHMFIANVVAVDVDPAYMDEKDTFHLSKAKPLAYSHGRYYGLGECLGSFGYSVRKTEKPEKPGKTGAGAKKGPKGRTNAPEAGAGKGPKSWMPGPGAGAGKPPKSRMSASETGTGKGTKSWAPGPGAGAGKTSNGGNRQKHNRRNKT